MALIGRVKYLNSSFCNNRLAKCLYTTYETVYVSLALILYASSQSFGESGQIHNSHHSLLCSHTLSMKVRPIVI